MIFAINSTMRGFTFVLVLSLFGFLAQARTGVDLSVATTVDTWNCLKSEHNVDYAIIRVYRSLGEVDTNSANTIKNVASAGIKDIGAYMFPCMPTASYNVGHNITCPSVEKQIQSTLDFLKSNNVVIQRDAAQTADIVAVNRMWLDIEDEVPSKYYDADPVKNQAFMQEYIDTLTNLQIPIGIYTTKTYWQNIMGNIEGYSKYPLWYPRYDNVDSMDFFATFGGWTEVQIKQTAGDAPWCGISQVDTDYSLDV